jgi:hypothetical protein
VRRFDPDQPRPRLAPRPPEGPWRKLPSGYTVTLGGWPVHPLCCHGSPVRPGSDVWAEDCAELATYARPFAGIEEYACDQHATGPRHDEAT